MKKKISAFVLLLGSYAAQAQIGIGTASPNASSVLELVSTTKGFLPPRLTTAQRNAIASPVAGLFIYNTTKDCLEWYNGTVWRNSCISATSNGNAIVSGYSCSTASGGTMTAGTAVSGVTQTITATVTTAGTYSISATANGVSFAGSGTFAGTGAQDIVLTASGTPVAAATSSFVLNTSPNCSFDRITNNNATSNGSAVVSAFTCTTASAGTMKVGIAVSGVTQTITATVTAAGTYSISTTSNGVTFAGSGTFAGTGAQDIVFTATGTPVAAGTSSFVLDTSPNCSFSRTTTLALAGGNAICDGSRPTIVVDITSSTGKIWMDRNLGASRAGTSSTDYEAYGCLYQWGRGNDGHASVTWTSSSAGTTVNGTTTTLSATDSPGHALFIINNGDWHSPKNDLLWQGVSGVNNPCPSGYRVPTTAEFAAEVTAYSIASTTTAYASPHKFVAAGHFYYSGGSLYNAGAEGHYWSSTVNGAKASSRFFSGGSTSISALDRANRFSVRCLKD